MPAAGASDSIAARGLHKYDIDLFNSQGQVAVSFRGFSTRVMSGEDALSNHTSSPHSDKDPAQAFDADFYQQLLESLVNNEISVDDAAELG